MSGGMSTFRERVEVSVTRERALEGLSMEVRGKLEELLWKAVDAIGHAENLDAVNVAHGTATKKIAKLSERDRGRLGTALTTAYTMRLSELSR